MRGEFNRRYATRKIFRSISGAWKAPATIKCRSATRPPKGGTPNHRSPIAPPPIDVRRSMFVRRSPAYFFGAGFFIGGTGGGGLLVWANLAASAGLITTMFEPAFICSVEGTMMMSLVIG